MTSKRPHSKSRLGCKQCKGRRIKCDQTPPCCNNCAKRGLECEYQEWSQLLTPGSFGATILHPLGRTPSPTKQAEAHWRCFDYADLARLHYFTIHTSQSLPAVGNEYNRHIWQHEVPQLAVSHPPLMHAILAFAAAHQATTEEQTQLRQSHMEAARSHFSKALMLFRSSVKEVTDERPDVLLCYCILVCFLTLFFEFDKPTAEKDPINDFVSLLGILSSSIGVLEVVQKPLRSTTIGSLLRHTWNTEAHAIAPDASTSLDSLERLVQSNQGRPGFDAATAATLTDAILKLRHFYSIVAPRPSSWAHILTWPIKLGPDFSKLLEERHPIALCALAHWFVPAHHAPSKWYVGDWPARAMNAIAQQLEDTEYESGIRWPLAEILR